ncbi:Hypothetical predicted protein [Paramuricea clavata]|uniref:Uncharacterized protein n=1 Tax=Paramuricea clavata TaxID=317549 RepID=A0A7D9LKW0_PARCT|nr:Hypothetical predicted protein [Paramuricea clavata]
MRLELEEEKLKNLRLKQQIKILSDEVKKSKSGRRQASFNTNSASTMETNNNIQINENNGPKTKDIVIDSLVPKIHLTKQSKDDSLYNLQNHEPEDMQIPVTTESFNHQLNNYKMKHVKQRSSHTLIPNAIKQTTNEPPPKRENKRPNLKINPSFDQQLKDCRTKHDSQCPISTTKRQPIKENKKTSVLGHNQQAVSFSKQHVNHRREIHYYARNKHNNKIRSNHNRFNKPTPKPANHRIHNQNQHRTPPAADYGNFSDFFPASLPFQLRRYFPTHPRRQVWIFYLKYVNRVTKR